MRSVILPATIRQLAFGLALLAASGFFPDPLRGQSPEQAGPKAAQATEAAEPSVTEPPGPEPVDTQSVGVEPVVVESAESGAGSGAGSSKSQSKRAAAATKAGQRKLSPTSRGVLPSEDQRKPGDPVPPEEILQEYELTRDRIKEAVGDVALWEDEGNSELLLNLLYRFRRISDLNIESTATKDDKLSELVGEPDSQLLKTFFVRGRVVMVQKIDVSSNYAKRFEMKRFYRCDLLVGEEELPAVVYSLQVPGAWGMGQAIDENVSFYGLFIHRRSSKVGVAPLVFLTKHLAWHSPTLLGDLGMDVGLLDNVVQKQPLLPQEQECFYQMLRALNVAGAAEMFRLARQDVIYEARKLVDQRNKIERRLEQLMGGSADLPANPAEAQQLERKKKLLQLRIDYMVEKRSHEFFPLLKKPEDHVGKLKTYRGTARRIVPVLVEQPELIKRYGIRKYYQMDMLVKLEGKLKLLKPASQGESASEAEVGHVGWTHPATVCFLELPEGMPTGDNMMEDVRVAGFFLKHWTFFDEEDASGEPLGRSAAMLIARRPFWERRPSTQSNIYLSTLAGGLFVVAVVGVWIGVWRMNCGDRRFQSVIAAKVRNSTEEVSLNDLDLDVRDGTDFRDMGSPDQQE